MKILYRATMKQLAVGETLPRSNYDYSEFSEYRRAAEELLEEYRPAKRPSRLSSWFACDSAANAARYLEGQKRVEPDRFIGQPSLYKLEVTEYTRHPMCLLDAIASKISKEEEELALGLANEYWTPASNWTFWEYLCPKIVVLEASAWPSSIDRWLAQQTYSADRKIRDALLGSLSDQQADTSQGS